jgi:hypothetical protein
MPQWRRQRTRSDHAEETDGPTSIDILSDGIASVVQSLGEVKAILLRLELLLTQALAAGGTTGRVERRGAPGVRDDAVLGSTGEQSSARDSWWSGLETVLREFMSRANEGPLSVDEARDLVQARGLRLEVARVVGDEWRVVAVEHPAARGQWFAVPVPRLPMGNASLETWYELSRYSGIDPLKPSQITKPALLSRQDGGWVLVEKGRIDGAY